VDWPVGGEVLVTSTALKDSRDWHRNDVSTIQSRKGRTLVLTPPLGARHDATDDYQAEVAYLTRTIFIQGAEGDYRPSKQRLACPDPTPALQLGSTTMPCADAFLDGYGAHVMAMGVNAVLRVSSVELRRVGQTNVLGRYPLHMHLMGNAGENSYVIGSSIHESYYHSQ
jgi:cell migration-inducing and hyaluronan-binding protein